MFKKIVGVSLQELVKVGVITFNFVRKTSGKSKEFIAEAQYDMLRTMIHDPVFSEEVVADEFRALLDRIKEAACSLEYTEAKVWQVFRDLEAQRPATYQKLKAKYYQEECTELDGLI